MAKKLTNEETAAAPRDAAHEFAAAEVAALTPAEAPKGISEEDIYEKVSVGLLREQAIEVITAQRAHDANSQKLTNDFPTADFFRSGTPQNTKR